MIETIHITYNGQAYEFANDQVDVGDNTPEQTVKDRIADLMGIDVSTLRDYTTTKTGTVLNIHPAPVFG